MNLTIPKNVKIYDVTVPPPKNTFFSLIGICVSYNYFDTLQFMLPVNHLHFEKIYVVTQEDDTQTVEFCKSFENVIVLFYHFKNNGKKFDKFGALNYAQSLAYQKYPDSWYLLIDSDILLPNNFSTVLKDEALNPECLYGANRHDVFKSVELLQKNKLVKESKPLFVNGKLTVIGFFQLYKKKGFHPNHFNSAAAGDVAFCQQFQYVCVLENIHCFHLGVPKQNWYGKMVSFIDDIHIPLKDIYYTCHTNRKNKIIDQRKTPTRMNLVLRMRI